LSGHTAELSACRYDFGCNMIASGSLDGTAKLWDARRTNSCCKTIFGHTDEVVIVLNEKQSDYLLYIMFLSVIGSGRLF